MSALESHRAALESQRAALAEQLDRLVVQLREAEAKPLNLHSRIDLLYAGRFALDQLRACEEALAEMDAHPGLPPITHVPLAGPARWVADPVHWDRGNRGPRDHEEMRQRWDLDARGRMR